MENISNQNQKIILPAETGSIVSKILSSYGLNETESESLEKLKSEKISWQLITINIARDFIKNIISEDNAVAQLKNKLEVSEETAKKIIADIKIKILPITKKVKIETNDIKNTKPEEMPPPGHPGATAKPPIKKVIKKISSTKTFFEPVANLSKQTESQQIKNISKKPDTYREPIE